MKKNTASQLFGTFLPYPIINSVTLESGGSISVPNKDPHIVSIYESEEDLPSTLAPPFGLKTNLKVAVRDVLDTAGMTSFFDKQDILEILDMVVIQSTNAASTSALLGTYGMDNNVSGLDYYVWKYYTEGSAPPGVEFSKQTLNFNEDVDYTKQINGNNVIEKSYNFNFYLPTASPSHLSYFCVIAVNFDDLANKYDINATDLYDFWNSAGTFEDYMESTHKVVIDGGSIVNVEHGYYLPNGQKWEGPVHYHNGTWMAGKKHTSTPHPVLTKKMTSSDAVIKDFRDFTDLPLMKDEFYKDQNKLTSLISTPFGDKLSEDIAGSKKSSIIYDAISYSTPYKLNNKTLSKVGLVFGLDMAEIQRRYSLIKADLSNEPVHTKIKTFSVFRTNLETDEAPKVVVKNTPPGVYLQEIFGSPTNYSFFHIPDQVEPGNYEYYIELELDRQKEINYVNMVLVMLQKAVHNLDTYYRAATRTWPYSPTTLDNKTEIVGSTLNQQQQARRGQIFNSSTGKFRSAFSKTPYVQKIHAAVLQDLAMLVKWAEMLYGSEAAITKKSLLEKVLSPETGTPDGILMVKKIVENLLQDYGKIFGGTKHLVSNGASNWTGNTGLTRQAVKTKTPEKIIIKLKSKLEVKDNLDYGYDYLPKYNNLQGAPVYNLSQWIASVFAEHAKYFATNPQDLQYTTTKGNLPNPLSHSEGHTTFSPHTTKAGQITLTPQSDPISYENCLLSIVDRNLSGVEANNKDLEYVKNVPGLSSNNAKILNSSKQLEEIFSTEGVSILPSNPFETNKLYTITSQEEKVQTAADPEDTATDSINYNGKLIQNHNSKVILMNMVRALDVNYSQLKSINFYSLKDITVGPFTPGDPAGPSFSQAQLPFDSDNIITIFKSQPVSFAAGQVPQFQSDPEFVEAKKQVVDKLIKELPMQTLSLLVGSVNPLMHPDVPEVLVNQETNPFTPASGESEDPRKDFESGYAKQWFNFDNLVKVEYLSGFEEGILNPQWKNIKGLLYPPKGNILCRLVKYENSMININRPEVLELPIYNEYFFIKYDQNLTMAATPQPTQLATTPAGNITTINTIGNIY